MSFSIMFLGAFAVFCIYHYTKPFGLSSPLRITNRYSTSVNGDSYEIVLVAWRAWYRFFQKPVRSESALREAWKKAGYASAASEDRCALFMTPGFSLPLGLYVSSELNGGRSVAMVLVAGVKADENPAYIESGFSLSDSDRYAVVPQGFVRTHPQAKPVCV